MNSLGQLSALSWLVLIAGGTVLTPSASAQVVNAPSRNVTKSDPLCPTISVSCPTSFEDGKVVIATAIVSGGNVAGVETYDWAIHGGTITEGLGTPKINFKVDAGRDSYTVSLKVGGLDSSCPASASCSTIICKSPPAVKSDSFGILPIKTEKARLDNFATILENAPGAMGYILSYPARAGGANEARLAAERARTYLLEQGIDGGRIVTVEGGQREELSVELWIVPTGAIPPKPAPSVDPGAVRRIASPARIAMTQSHGPRQVRLCQRVGAKKFTQT